MTSFLRKKNNRTNEVAFINETDLKPKGRILYCPGTFNDSGKYVECLTRVNNERKHSRSLVDRRLYFLGSSQKII